MAAAIADPCAQALVILRLLCAELEISRGSSGLSISRDVVLSVHGAHATVMLYAFGSHSSTAIWMSRHECRWEYRAVGGAMPAGTNDEANIWHLGVSVR